ncbi:MAG TPA: ribosome-associated translation inhibitor RaiA [Gaiellaceae bacterium]|nr:ribosome-associated translation inhibitor RaiA [Gaiellaceae bacterium]
MQLHVKGKNLEVNDSIRAYAERKLQKLDRRVHESTRVEIELAVEHNPRIAESQVAEATVHLKGHTLRAREAARDMKAAIDELTDKLVRQVRDLHDKRVDGRKHVAASVAGEVDDARREDGGASGAARDEPEVADPAEAEITES